MKPSPLRLGMIVPSSNTVVEPVTCAMSATINPQVPNSVHFSRFALTAIQTVDPAAAYYDSGALLAAALLLADARCHVICWNGSAGGIVGFDRDRQLCSAITSATGIPATTSSLALIDQLRVTGVRHFAMVTLNPPEMNETIKTTFGKEGFFCSASSHRTDMADNFAMAMVAPGDIAKQARACIRSSPVVPDALVIYGTNTHGAAVAPALTHELGLPVYDSVAWGMIGALRKLDIEVTHLVN
jgi:maleate isomerase